MKKCEQKQKLTGLITGLAWQKCLSLSIVLLLLSLATPVYAQEKTADDWQFGAAVYLWGATIKLHDPAGNPTVISFSDILKNLDLAAMATFDARKDKFSMLTDVLYLDISKTNKNYEGDFMGHPVTGKLKAEMKAWVLNLIGGYNLIDSGKNVFDVTAGARYLDIKVPVTFTSDDFVLTNKPQGDGWDGVIGLKGRHNFPDGHYFNYYADIGGGHTKLTWQTVANFAYDYKKFTGIVGYRYLKWNFKNDSPALDDLVIHGPYAALKWSF